MTHHNTIGRDKVSEALLNALLDDERTLRRAAQVLGEARVGHDIAARKYAAMREAVRERLGASPYADNVWWPLHYSDEGDEIEGAVGRKFPLRFVRMKFGDAILEILNDSELPLSLEEIADALNAGGMYVKDMRTVNAALINTKGVQKIEQEGVVLYYYEVEESDADNLPW